MYLVVIAWIYVVLMMSVAEATNTTGTVLGAIITFVLYGLGPCGLVVYLMRTPARKKALKQRRAEEQARHDATVAKVMTVAEPQTTTSHAPDGGSHAASSPKAIAEAIPEAIAPITGSPSIAPVRKEL